MELTIWGSTFDGLIRVGVTITIITNEFYLAAMFYYLLFHTFMLYFYLCFYVHGLVLCFALLM